MATSPLPVSYVLPIKSSSWVDPELIDCLRALTAVVEDLIVVDASGPSP